MPVSGLRRFAMGIVIASFLLLLTTSSFLSDSSHQGRMLQQNDETRKGDGNRNNTGRSGDGKVGGDGAGIAMPIIVSFLGFTTGLVVTMKVVKSKQRRSNEDGGGGGARSRRRTTTVGGLTVNNSDIRKPKVLMRPPSGNSFFGRFLTRNGAQRNRRVTFESAGPGDQWGLRLVPTPGRSERNMDNIGTTTSLSFVSRTGDPADVSRAMRRTDSRATQENIEQEELESRSLRRAETNESAGKYKSTYMHHMNLKWKRRATPMSSSKTKKGLMSRLAGGGGRRTVNESTAVKRCGTIQATDLDDHNDNGNVNDEDSRVESMRRLETLSTHTPTTLLSRNSTMSMVFSKLVGMTYGDKKNRVSDKTLGMCRCKRKRRPVKYDTLTMKQLRHVCRLRGISPGGSHDALVCKLMISRVDLGMATCKQCLLNIPDPNISDEEEEEEEEEHSWNGKVTGNVEQGVEVEVGIGGTRSIFKSGIGAGARTSSLRSPSPWRPSVVDGSFSELV